MGEVEDKSGNGWEAEPDTRSRLWIGWLRNISEEVVDGREDRDGRHGWNCAAGKPQRQARALPGQGLSLASAAEAVGRLWDSGLCIPARTGMG